jgi:hypothetical protein
VINTNSNPIRFDVKSTFAAATCPDKAATAPRLSLVNVANNRALVNVYIPSFPGNPCEIEDARQHVKDLFEDFHYGDLDSSVLGVTDVVVRTIDIMPVTERQYLAWVTFAGVEIATEVDTEIPGEYEWTTSRGIAAR